MKNYAVVIKHPYIKEWSALVDKRYTQKWTTINPQIIRLFKSKEHAENKANKMLGEVMYFDKVLKMITKQRECYNAMEEVCKCEDKKTPKQVEA